LTHGFQDENSAYSSWNRLFRNVYLGFNRKFNIRASAVLFFCLSQFFNLFQTFAGYFFSARSTYL